KAVGSANELLTQRKEYWQGESVTAIKNKWTKKIAEQQDAVKELNDNLSSIKTLHFNQTQRKKDLQQRIEQQTTQIQAFNQQILNKCTELQIDKNWLLEYDYAKQLLNVSYNDIEAKKLFIEGLTQAKIQQQTALNHLLQAIEKMAATKPATNNLAESLALEKAQQAFYNSILQEQSNINQTIQFNQSQFIKMQELIEERNVLRQTWENWQQLNDLIGSSDGKKFRQLAQEYSLDVLLAHANVHLQQLAPRYLLSRIDNSLGMQVTDRDMADEKRSVHSLSGGESFLVSLALALGLASVTSGSMKVESLFIDEGFGSLDQQTLNIAMNALEKLQSMGRKVGIITHVQEMTERIQTQIVVKKLSNGKSSIYLKA
ncbi:MAG: SbcC/MukB-like Walker B domain-containing protein, partial [Chitinophagaceae bacterium]